MTTFSDQFLPNDKKKVPAKFQQDLLKIAWVVGGKLGFISLMNISLPSNELRLNTDRPLVTTFWWHNIR